MPKHTCSLVVAAILFDGDKICLVQEAKETFYEKWYLPSGRVEEGENIYDAMVREVKEEAGFDIEPLSILAVEHKPANNGKREYIRFTFSARIIGGQLKSVADDESIKAQWWPIEQVLDQDMSLRSLDIIPLVKAAQSMAEVEGDTGATLIIQD